jgi:hypothetical protein
MPKTPVPPICSISLTALRLISARGPLAGRLVWGMAPAWP